MGDRKMIYLDDAIDALAEYIHNVDKVMGTGYLSAYDCKDAAASVLADLSPAQPETYEEKLKEIADELSEKFAYLNTCPNERDIILGYLGVKRPSGIHCDTDCTYTKCESNHRYNKLLSEEPEWHDCDPTDENTLPEPGSWAIWCDKEDHKIIARWKEDAIDHFWPDQRMFDFDLEDAVAWTEIPKRRED